MKYISLLLALSAIVSCQDDDTLKVSIYYEALCPDSIKFITEQFYPGFQFLAPYLEWYFYPYGFAKKQKINGKWNFTCQHGPRECFSDKGQACALELSKSEVGKVEYVNCIESSYDPGSIEAIYRCAEVGDIKWSELHACLTNGTGDELLARYGDFTAAVNPKIKFIPTIIFNDAYDDNLQNGAIENFMLTACKLLKYVPKPCRDHLKNNIIVVKI